MSALPIDDLPTPRPRALRFARPVNAATLPPPERRTYRPGDREIPVPPALAIYVRGPRHFALLLGALTERAEREGRQQLSYAELESAQEILRRFQRNLFDPHACYLLRQLFPPVACGECGRPFIRETGQRAHCGDSCRRRSAAHAQAERRAAR